MKGNSQTFIYRHRRLGQERSDEYRRSWHCLPIPRVNASWRGLYHARSQTLEIGSDRQRVLFVEERLEKGYEHPCTVEDLAHLLSRIPLDVRRPLRILVLHQPTRDEDKIWPCDGRAFPWFTFRNAAGPAIFVYASPVAPHKWRLYSKRAPPHELFDLKLLRTFGASIRELPDYYRLEMSADAYRAFTLYHVLFHELRHLHQPSGFAGDREYDAERFAAAYAQRLHRLKIIPFRRRRPAPRNRNSRESLSSIIRTL